MHDCDRFICITASSNLCNTISKHFTGIFSLNLDLNTWKLEAKTSTSAGLKFKTTGVHNTDNGKVLGVLESEYACKDYGKHQAMLVELYSGLASHNS